MHYVNGAINSVGAGANKNATLGCPSGQQLINGGFSGTSYFDVQFDGPSDASTWRVQVFNSTGSTSSFQVVVVCYG
jgi:hypothetical protein